MKFFVSSLAVLLLAAGAAASAPTRSEAAVKCAADAPILFPDAPDFVIIVDGKVTSEEAFEKVDRKTIESIAIVCPDALYQRFRVKARVAGTVVVTSAAARPAPKSGVEPATREQP